MEEYAPGDHERSAGAPAGSPDRQAQGRVSQSSRTVAVALAERQAVVCHGHSQGHERAPRSRGGAAARGGSVGRSERDSRTAGGRKDRAAHPGRRGATAKRQDGGDRTTDRGHRARLQQPSPRHHRRAGPDPAADRVGTHCRGGALSRRRHRLRGAGRGADPPPARLLAPSAGRPAAGRHERADRFGRASCCGARSARGSP